MFQSNFFNQYTESTLPVYHIKVKFAQNNSKFSRYSVYTIVKDTSSRNTVNLVYVLNFEIIGNI